MIGLGTVEAVVQFHPPTFLADCGSRKVLAGYCHARIAGGMVGALRSAAANAEAPDPAAHGELSPRHRKRQPEKWNRPLRGDVQSGERVFIKTTAAR